MSMTMGKSKLILLIKVESLQAFLSNQWVEAYADEGQIESGITTVNVMADHRCVKLEGDQIMVTCKEQVETIKAD